MFLRLELSGLRGHLLLKYRNWYANGIPWVEDLSVSLVVGDKTRLKPTGLPQSTPRSSSIWPIRMGVGGRAEAPSLYLFIWMCGETSATY
jgi:hypothetical protein